MPENFVSRWARLKRSSDARPGAELSRGLSVDAVAPIDTEAISGHRRDDEIIEEPFDPASLPSIETITVDTDIRGFLQCRVPVELTRAALRQAWASDPVIRDFIGIAENQWDFNDPNAIPGFGPLQDSDDMPALLARALGRHKNLAEMGSELLASAETSLPAAADPEAVALDREPQLASDDSPPVDGFPLDVGRGAGAASANDSMAEGMESSRRSHGSALPR
jgi:hypothetical protein